MIEQKDFIVSSDGKKIYFVQNTREDSPKNRVFVIGHGLTGDINESLHHHAKFYFPAHAGADVVRISFYGDEDDARKLDECTVADHAADLNALISHLKETYEKVYYIGHSYGGLTALLANPNVVATCFWDSTYTPDFWDDEASYSEALDAYILNWGVKAIASKAMVEEAKALTYEIMKGKAAAFSSPACVVLADGNEETIEGRHKLYGDLPAPKDEVVIKGAGHCFHEGGTVFELLSETAKWFSKY